MYTSQPRPWRWALVPVLLAAGLAGGFYAGHAQAGQPRLALAARELREARTQLERAPADATGRRWRALKLVKAAQRELDALPGRGGDEVR